MQVIIGTQKISKAMIKDRIKILLIERIAMVFVVAIIYWNWED